MANNVDITAGTGTTISTTTVGSGFSAYSTSGQAATGILYCSANTSTAPTPVTNANPLPVSLQNSSVAVTAASLPLPTGAATAAKQPALGTAGAASTDVLTIQGIASMTPLLAAQSGTWTVAATQSGTWSSRLQDGSGNAVTSRVTGSSRPLEIAVVDASGNQITSFGGSGGTASNIGSTFPTTATAVGYSDGTNMVGARTFDLDTGAGVQNVLGVGLRLSASGGSVEGGTATNPIRTDPTGTTTQPVSAASLPLPTGAATAAKQPALGTAGTPSSDVITVQGVTSMTALKVDGSAVTQPVSGTVTANAGTGTFTTTSASIGATGSSPPASATYLGAKVSSALQGLTATQTSPGLYALHCDVRTVGGSLGQTVASLSMPVAIASDQTVFPISQDSATLYAGTTALTPKFAVVTASSSGDTTVIAAVTSKRIRVLRYSLSANGGVQSYFRDGTAGTAISGVKYMTQFGGAGGTFCPQGIFQTSAGTALVINLNGAVAVSGEITYVEV